ncbi:MAG TPA: hypothetical protein VNI20_14250 [Fimbriimonadaceae bacterium]|nr:hypothetical protein [Fimbriimonadaceae bacterium]
MKTASLKTPILVGASTFVIALAALGCFGKKHGASKGDRFSNNSELQTYVVPYKNAYLIMGGTSHETTVESTKTSSSVTFLMRAHGTVLDEENYTYDSDSFNYIGNKDYGEFKEGIPILKFPFAVGDKWDWDGTYEIGGRSRKSSAVITTDSERLVTVAGDFNTVRVTVDLEIESGGSNAVKQTLKFWFAPDYGMVKREFEYSGTREPMPPEATAYQQ